MAQLTVTEFVTLGKAHRNFTVMPEEPPLAEQVAGITGTSTQLSFNVKTRIVRVNCDTACCIKIDTLSNNPVATTTNRRLPANTTEYLSLPGEAYNNGNGLQYAIAVIATT